MPVTLSNEEYLEIKNLFGAMMDLLPTGEVKVQELSALMGKLYEIFDARALAVPPAFGDRPAFPRGIFPGMTYRQWLIGRALSCLSVQNNPEEIATYAMQIADAVIARLE
jgi:hypothetical protein